MRYAKIAAAVVMVAALLVGCSQEGAQPADESAGYRQVTAQEAKDLMDSEDGYAILDVRTDEEYAEGHIPGAILIPLADVVSQAEQAFADKDQLILIYCRSGNRSKQAAEALVELGYTNIVEFGGINDWPYEIEQ